MSNNDEHVIYSPTQWDRKQDRQVVLSRLVTQNEIDAGLDTKNQSLFGKKEPEITRLIDSLYRIQDRIKFWFKIKNDLGQAIAYIVSQDYYDCMSGGMDKYVASALIFAMHENNVNMDTQVYPRMTEEEGEDSWYTLQDFCEGMKDVPDFYEEVIKNFPQGKIPGMLALTSS